MRSFLAIPIVLALTVARTNATNFWLSPSNTSSVPPANASEIPMLPNSGKVYVWARPDADKTLLNWSLNIHTSRTGVINFTSVDVLNPLLGMVGVPPKPFKRYEFVNDSFEGSMLAPTLDGQSMQGFTGFAVANDDALGVGIGPQTTGPPSMDPYYNAADDSWLIAEIAYVANGNGAADLFLQVGNRMNNSGEDPSENNVILGALTDPALNGVSGRQQDSATPEARIIAEPSSCVLATLGVLAICASARSMW